MKEKVREWVSRGIPKAQQKNSEIQPHQWSSSWFPGLPQAGENQEVQTVREEKGRCFTEIFEGWVYRSVHCSKWKGKERSHLGCHSPIGWINYTQQNFHFASCKVHLAQHLATGLAPNCVVKTRMQVTGEPWVPGRSRHMSLCLN